MAYDAFSPEDTDREALLSQMEGAPPQTRRRAPSSAERSQPFWSTEAGAYMQRNQAKWQPYADKVRDQLQPAQQADVSTKAAPDTTGLDTVIDKMQTPAEGPAAADVTTKPSYAGWGQYTGNRNAALDPTKMAQADEALSPKYAIARTLSHFDPSQGLTPEVLAALNALGIGTFSADSDRLTVGGNVDPRFEGVLTSDMVRDLGSPTARWGGWGSVIPGQQKAAQRGAAQSAAQAGPGSFDKIQSLMPTDTNFYHTLQSRLQELLGGPQATDRNALLSLMSR